MLDSHEVHKRLLKNCKIAKPSCNQLDKDAAFIFDETYLEVFSKMKEKLISTSIIALPI